MSRVAPDRVATAAILGMGSVGSGWAALLLAEGIAVRALDPMDGAAARSAALIAQSWPSVRALGHSDLEAPPTSEMAFFPTVEEAAAGADVVIEAAPERLELKRDVIRKADAVTDADMPILSSAGGIPPTALQEGCTNPARVLVMHPFNPAHLIPLVEIVPGRATGAGATAWAVAFARRLGKQPIAINAEISGHMVNRLQFALVREAVNCLANGIATPQDIDAAVRYGLAPRWLLMGPLHTVGMAGGPGGMRGILDHAGPAMEQWWRPTEDVTLSDDVRDRLVDAARKLDGAAGFEDWARWRDAQLVSVLTRQAQADATRPGATD